jgi:hypothetical protein
MSKRREGVNAAAWFYAQPGFHAQGDSRHGGYGHECHPGCDVWNDCGVGRDCGRSDEQTQRATDQQTVMPGAPDENPDEAVSTVTAGETAPCGCILAGECTCTQIAECEQCVHYFFRGELSRHLRSCPHCFELSDGTPVRCSDALRLKREAR